MNDALKLPSTPLFDVNETLLNIEPLQKAVAGVMRALYRLGTHSTHLLMALFNSSQEVVYPQKRHARPGPAKAVTVET